MLPQSAIGALQGLRLCPTSWQRLHRNSRMFDACDSILFHFSQPTGVVEIGCRRSKSLHSSFVLSLSGTGKITSAYAKILLWVSRQHINEYLCLSALLPHMHACMVCHKLAIYDRSMSAKANWHSSCSVQQPQNSHPRNAGQLSCATIQ